MTPDQIKKLQERNTTLTIADIKKYALRMKRLEELLASHEGFAPEERQMHAIKIDAYRQIVIFIEQGTPELA